MVSAKIEGTGARGGRGAQLAGRLLRGASVMADVPACELWLVQRDPDDSAIDDELFELRTRDAVGVAPASARAREAGRDGLEVLAFGPRSPGDGEMVADWWTT